MCASQKSVKIYLFDKVLINCIFKDTDDHIWIGTFNDGVYFIQNPKLQNISFTSGRKILPVSSASFIQNSIVVGTNNGLFIYDKSNNNTSSQSQTPTTSNTSMTMADMNKELATKTGSDFDKTFIEMMIQHHQGAIEMAKLSETRADRQEIKTLSQNIIAAQEKEIADMKQWQMDWGFVQSGGSMPGMNH